MRLHEQNDTVRDFGAGIVMWRNAMLALEVIGVAQSVQENGVKPDYYETFLNGTSVSLEVPGSPTGRSPGRSCTRCWPTPPARPAWRS